ncbi:aminoglycoside 6-adenylyltransferase [Facklamia sp. DSM 111018]|uniref:Aminoglycoside 6-adenylyltransferase n=1 Tax=Facklamia lactis TaxID=2749967 RepID=A0ABS0LNT7_9LACT|nr:aminoglycoside 6-adenylyltransferase [Facklamia lactis]MBG9985763.1 aminoglycoside 6-adenylyltransferase [Facklamia lactis]
MRSEKEIMDLTIRIAMADDRIEGVLLNGSRANPRSRKDRFQDYDLVYITRYVNEIAQEKDWPQQFGDVLIMQTPDKQPGLTDYSVFAFLMQFKDLTRIDLRLIHPEVLTDRLDDAYSQVLLDKQGSYGAFNFNRELELYHTYIASEEEIKQWLNEIFWVSTYVVKGIARQDRLYAESLLSHVLRKMLIELIKQEQLIDLHRAHYNFGKFDQGILEHLKDQQTFLSLYGNTSLQEIEEHLRIIIEESHGIAQRLASYYGFHYDSCEYEAAKTYFSQVLGPFES